jgi:hypothetical protein
MERLARLLRTVGQTMESAEAGPKTINMYFERIEKEEIASHVGSQSWKGFGSATSVTRRS